MNTETSMNAETAMSTAQNSDKWRERFANRA